MRVILVAILLTGCMSKPTVKATVAQAGGLIRMVQGQVSTCVADTPDTTAEVTLDFDGNTCKVNVKRAKP
jgi:hypothetical protein